jgi:hypothetical protein
MNIQANLRMKGLLSRACPERTYGRIYWAAALERSLPTDLDGNRHPAFWASDRTRDAIQTRSTGMFLSVIVAIQLHARKP